MFDRCSIDARSIDRSIYLSINWHSIGRPNQRAVPLEAFAFAFAHALFIRCSGRFEVTLRSQWDHFGVTLGSFWASGGGFGSLSSRFGVIRRQNSIKSRSKLDYKPLQTGNTHFCEGYSVHAGCICGTYQSLWVLFGRLWSHIGTFWGHFVAIRRVKKWICLVESAWNRFAKLCSPCRQEATFWKKSFAMGPKRSQNGPKTDQKRKSCINGYEIYKIVGVMHAVVFCWRGSGA